ncbi:MAG: alpha/beta hydrolase [Chitinophagaceae bacterium]|nr:alpha/beta hydrolase [Chitinophagaceae bacterium]
MGKVKNILYNTASIYYTVNGSGKTVVLLHGFGEDGSIWKYQADQLQKNFRVIVPDLPGWGRSEMLNEKEISIEVYSEIIKKILDQELDTSAIPAGHDKVALIGHSMGGYIAMGFAEKYPENLNGLGLFHSTSFADTTEKIKTRLKGIEFIKNNGAVAFLKTSVPGLFTGHFKEKYPAVINKLLSKGIQYLPETLIQYYQAMIKRPDRTEVLKDIRCPVLFISGEKDLAVPIQYNLQECQLPAVAYIHIFDSVAHMAMLEEKNKSCEYLHDYLKNL